MRIRGATVEQWRGIERKEIEFAPGLNLVFGRNETGKSSLMEAMYTALTGDPASTKKEYKSLVPWNTRVKARVHLTLETDQGQLLRLFKSFPKGDAQLHYLNGDGEKLIAEGRETDGELLRRLGLKEEHRELLKLLWVRQGEGLDLISGKKGAVHGSVVRTVKDIIRGQLLAPAAEQLYAELAAERADIFTARGLKTASGSRGARIHGLQEEYGRIRAEEQRLREQLETVERSKQRYEELYRENEELERQLAAAETKLRRLREQRRLYEEWQRLREAAAPLERELAGYREKERTRGNALGRLKPLERAFLQALKREIEETARRREEQARLEGEKAELEQELAAGTGIGRDQLEEAERTAAELDRIRTLLQEEPLSVEIRPAVDTELLTSADGEEQRSMRFTETVSFTVYRSFTAEKEGEFALSVTGPLSEERFTELSERRGELEDRLGELLSAAGAETLTRMRELYEDRRERRSRLESLRGFLGDRGLEELDDRMRELQEKLAAAGAEPQAAAEEAPESRGSKGRTEGRTEDRTEGRSEAEVSDLSAELSAGEIEQRMAREQSTVESAEAGMREALKHAGAAEAAELEEKAEEARRRAEEKRREMEAAEPQETEAADEKAVSRAERTIEELRGKIARGREEMARLEGEFTGMDDISERLADCEYRRRSVAEELRREWTDVHALETVFTFMRQEKERLEERIYSPLEEKIGRALADLTGERYAGVEVLEELSGLGVEARTYDGSSRQVALEELSFGTREQLSFLFRLALGEVLSERQRQVLVLDDSFVNSDERRLSWLLEELGRAAGAMQCILFTCSNVAPDALPEGARRIDL
jgi:DNA repair exonuclease SbcCD ATPase subunit